MPTQKLLDQVRTVATVSHFSLSTERAYSDGSGAIVYHQKKHRIEIAEAEIRQVDIPLGGRCKKFGIHADGRVQLLCSLSKGNRAVPSARLARRVEGRR